MRKYIFEVPQVVDEKENEKQKRKAARDTRELRKLCVKLEVGQECLKQDEEKGIICKCCVENKQSLVAQNVLKSTRFILMAALASKNGVHFISREEGSASTCTAMP